MSNSRFLLLPDARKGAVLFETPGGAAETRHWVYAAEGAPRPIGAGPLTLPFHFEAAAVPPTLAAARALARASKRFPDAPCVYVLPKELAWRSDPTNPLWRSVVWSRDAAHALELARAHVGRCRVVKGSYTPAACGTYTLLVTGAPGVGKSLLGGAMKRESGGAFVDTDACAEPFVPIASAGDVVAVGRRFAQPHADADAACARLHLEVVEESDLLLPADLPLRLQAAIGDPPDEIRSAPQLRAALARLAASARGQGPDFSLINVFVGYSQSARDNNATLHLITADVELGELTVDTVEEFTTDCPSGWTTATHVRLLRSSCVTAEEAAVIVEADGAELHLSRGVRTLDVWERGDQIFATIGGDVRKVVVETVNRGDDYYPMWSIECSPLFELCESVRSALDARFWATFGDDLSDIEGALRECSLLGLGWDEFVGIVEASRGDHGICRRVVERLGAWAAADVDALD